MRIVLVIATLTVAASPAFAQEQEARLIDRLLRPNLALENPAQKKTFGSTQTTQFNKPATIRTFPVVQINPVKAAPGDHAFPSPRFTVSHFRGGDSAANISPRSQLTKTDTVITASTAPASTRVAPESSETIAMREYADTRPFLVKGKSQKALQTQNKPLTIEQVRELLNKSK